MIGIISADNLILKYNTELCNDFSNLIYRTIGMIKKYGLETESLNMDLKKIDNNIIESVAENIAKYREYFEGFMLQKAIEEILDIISKSNKYIDKVEPWKLFKEKNNVDKEKSKKIEEDLNIFIYTLINMINIVGILLKPIIPDSSKKVFESLNIDMDDEKLYIEYQNLIKSLEENNKQEIFKEMKIMPKYDSKPIFERLTEEQENRIREIFG